MSWPYPATSFPRKSREVLQTRTKELQHVSLFCSQLVASGRTAIQALAQEAPPGERPPFGATAPRLEALEDRTLLSTLTVTNNKDSGSGSLRAEIAAANSNGDTTNTINFAPALDGQTITLSSGELKITKSVNIDGPGLSLLTVSGGGASPRRVFEIDNGATVTLANLTIANGQTTSAGMPGVQLRGQLGGGGILNDAGATLNLTSCAVVNNKAYAGSYAGLSPIPFVLAQPASL